MESKKCQYKLKTGPHMGEKCGRPVSDDPFAEDRCDLCWTIQDLKIDICGDSEEQKICKNQSDPYNEEKCSRPAVYRGYCLLCLSLY